MAKSPGGMEFLHGQPIRLPPLPDQLPAVPLNLRLPERPEVIVGQAVRRGQALLQPLHESHACYVSPVTATVRDVRPAAAGGYEVNLEPPGPSVVTTLEASAPRGRKLDNWLLALRQVGPWADPDGSVGLIAQLDAARNRPVDTLICVGVDPFPPCPDRSSALMSFPDDAVLGTLVLADVLNIRNVVMQAGRVPALVSRLRSSCRRYRLRLQITGDHYPSADPTMVAWQTVRRMLPYGHNPVDQGIIMITPWTAIRLGRWVTLRRLDVARPVLVARFDRGEPLSAHYVMPGQPVASFVEDAAAVIERGGRVLEGDPMTGHTLPQPVSVRYGQTLLTILPPRQEPEVRPCIQCGWCLDVCPTRLDPAGMLDAAQRHNDDAWLAEQLPWCVGCGLCSYVCPTALPLTQTFTRVRQEMEHLS